jgi:hypothetical protein
VGKATLPRPPWGWRRCQELIPDKPYATRPRRACQALSRWLPELATLRQRPRGVVPQGPTLPLNVAAPDRPRPEPRHATQGLGGGLKGRLVRVARAARKRAVEALQVQSF